jgi:hypothetical protein
MPCIIGHFSSLEVNIVAKLPNKSHIQKQMDFQGATNSNNHTGVRKAEKKDARKKDSN